MGRHSALAVMSVDPLLSFAAAVGLASVRGTALIVDAVAVGDAQQRTLADLVDEGPTRTELGPGRSGVGLIAAGELEPDQIATAFAEFAGHWPSIVVRTPVRITELPTVPVVPLYPVPSPVVSLPHVAVWQPVHRSGRAPGPGPVLPRLPLRQLRRILARTLPRSSRWLAAWRPVWDMQWD